MPKKYVSYNDIPKVLAAVDKAFAREAVEVQKHVIARARTKSPSKTNPGPYATGATMAGLYIVHAGGSDYAARWRDAKKVGRKNQASHKQDQMQLEKTEPQVYVSYAVGMFDYNRRVHNGWAHKKKYVKAQPFLRDSNYEERAAHTERLMAALRKIKGIR